MSRCSITETTNSNNNPVEKLIEDILYVPYDEIEAETSWRVYLQYVSELSCMEIWTEPADFERNSLSPVPVTYNLVRKRTI